MRPANRCAAVALALGNGSMRYRLRILLCSASAFLIGCSEAPTGPDNDRFGGLRTIELPQLMVSNAIDNTSPEGTAGGALASTRTQTVAYVSLPPGTLPAVETAVLRNASTAAPAAAITLVDGGFDPVALAASAGDRLELTLDRPGGPVRATFVVPGRRLPAVVRVSPSPARTDVSLNTAPAVIFTEPVDPGSVVEGIELLSGAGPVPGTVRTRAGEPWVAEFLPAAPLQAGTAYELRITTQVRDLDGDYIGAGIAISLVTQGLGPSVTGIYERVTSSSIGPHRYTLFGNGRFLLQYGSAAGSSEYGGSYSISGSALSLAFDGWSVAGPWLATAEIRGDSLFVAYNIVMLLSDFEDGVFVRSAASVARTGRLVFHSLDGSDSRIYAMNPDGTSILDLGVGLDPDWSPDGKRIAFWRHTRWNGSASAAATIFVMNADGSGVTPVTSGYQPTWSPDGKRLAFGCGGLCVVNVDGTGRALLALRELTHTGSGSDLCTEVTNPAWSPDGATIAFTRWPAFAGCMPYGLMLSFPFDFWPELWLVEANGIGLRALTEGERTGAGGSSLTFAAYASWSPDGEQIAFYGISALGRGIRVINRDGSGVRTLWGFSGPWSNDDSYGGPAWSPDGREIIVPELFPAPGDSPTQFRILAADGSGASTVMDARFRPFRWTVWRWSRK